MIAVDTSALIAILFLEEEAARFKAILTAETDIRIAAPTVLEMLMVTTGRKLPESQRRVRTLLDIFAMRIVPFDEALLAAAHDAFHHFGKGRHRAGLNFGDCMAYALAKSLGVPLLFKGNDLALTDIEAAI